jgi:hypothetical protein
MSDPQSKPAIGGEYGEVRANIDVEKLTAYLVRNISSIRAPIEVKQFKVGPASVPIGLAANVGNIPAISLARCVW